MDDNSLYNETLYAIGYSGHTVVDIANIGSDEVLIDITDFFKVAKRTRRDNNGYYYFLPWDLVIVFDDNTWLSREKDINGCCRWAYNVVPRMPLCTPRHITSLIGRCGVSSLAETLHDHGSYKINFYDETIEALADSGHEVSDIDWVGSYGIHVKTDLFFDMAKKTEYPNHWSGPYINLSLCIVFKDGTWLSRKEYDGHEWWEFNYLTPKPYYYADKPELIDPKFLMYPND